MTGMRDDILRILANLIRFGTVASVDYDAERITVKLADITTTPIKWATPRAGDTAVWNPPSEGEQVIVLSPNGDLAAGFALPSIFCAAFAKPPGATKDNTMIAFSDGAVLLYDTASHRLSARLPDKGSFSVTAPGGMRLEGSLQVSENISAGNGATGSFTTPTGLTVMVQDGLVTNIY